MNFQTAFVFCILACSTPLQCWAQKRFKRNSVTESKNSRIKEDFVPLRLGTLPDNEETNDKALNIPNSYNITNNHTLESDKKSNVSLSLASILRERKRKFNERINNDRTAVQSSANALYSQDNKVAIKNNQDKSLPLMEKLENTSGNTKKYWPSELHSTNVVGSRTIKPATQHIQQPYRRVSPITSLEQIMKFGNMMMFQVGMDAMPYSPLTNHLSYTPQMISPELRQQQSFYQQPFEPSFDYVFSSIEGPQENLFKIKTPIQPSMENLMQTALDTLLSDNSQQKVKEIELTCPLHHKKKSTKNGVETNDDADLIQVCSCRFIK